MSRRSVRKGKAWERECARLLEEATGLRFRRVLTETREGNEGDVDAPGSPVVVQCKVGARPNPYRALQEAVEAAADTDRLPVALVRKNGAGGRPPEDLAVLRIEDFRMIVARLADERDEGGAGP